MAVATFLIKRRHHVSDDELCADLSDSSNSSTIFELPICKKVVSSTPIQKRAKTVQQVLPFESPSSRLSVIPKLGHDVNKISSAAVPDENVEKQKALLEDIVTSNKKSFDSPLSKRHRNSEQNDKEKSHVSPLKRKRGTTEQVDVMSTDINNRKSVLFYHKRVTLTIPDYEIVLSSDEDEEKEKNNNKKSTVKNKKISKINQNPEENNPSKSLSEQKINNKTSAAVSPLKKNQVAETIRNSINNVDFEVGGEYVTDINVDNRVFAKLSNPQNNHPLNSVSSSDTNTDHKNDFASGVHEENKNISTANSSNPTMKTRARQFMQVEQNKTVYSSSDEETDKSISKNRNLVKRGTAQINKKVAKSENDVNKFQELSDDVVPCTKSKNADNVKLAQKKDCNEEVILNTKKRVMSKQKSQNKRKKQLQIEPNNQSFEKKSLDGENIEHVSNENAKRDEDDKKDIRTSDRNRVKPLPYWLPERRQCNYTDVLAPYIAEKTTPKLSDILSTEIENKNISIAISSNATMKTRAQQSIQVEQNKTVYSSSDEESDKPISKNRNLVKRGTAQISKKFPKSDNDVNKFQELSEDDVVPCTKSKNADNVKLAQKKDCNEEIVLNTKKRVMSKQKSQNKRKKQLQIEPHNQSFEKKSLDGEKIEHVSNENAKRNEDDKKEIRTSGRIRVKPLPYWLPERCQYSNIDFLAPTVEKTTPKPSDILSTEIDKENSAKKRQTNKTNKKVSRVKNDDEKQKTLYDKTDINSGSKNLDVKKSELFVNNNHSETEENLNNSELRIIEKAAGGKKTVSKSKKQMENFDKQQNERIPTKNKKSESPLSDIRISKRVRCKPKEYWLPKRPDCNDLEPMTTITSKTRPEWLERVLAESKNDSTVCSSNANKKVSNQWSTLQNKIVDANRNSETNNLFSENKNSIEERKQSSPAVKKSSNLTKIIEELKMDRKEKSSKKPQQTEKHYPPDAINSDVNACRNENVDRSNITYAHAEKLSENQPEKKGGRHRNPPKINVNYRSNAISHNENTESDEDAISGLFSGGKKKKLSVKQLEKKRGNPKNPPKMEANYRSSAISHNEDTESDENAIGGLLSGGKEKKLSAKQPEKKRGKSKNSPKMEANYRSNAISHNENTDSDEDVIEDLFSDGEEKKLSVKQPEKRQGRSKNIPQMEANYQSNALNYNEEDDSDNDVGMHEDIEKNLKGKQKKKNEKIAKTVLSDNVKSVMNLSSSDSANRNLPDTHTITIVTNNGPVEIKSFTSIKNTRFVEVANGLFLSDNTYFLGTATRFLRLKPKTVKHKTIPKISNMVFLVLRGMVKFQISQSTLIARVNDQITVPRFMPYSIENPSSTEEAFIYNVVINQ